MRVVAGSARGRRLRAPNGTAIRPTSARVREAVFNSLRSMDALLDATVVDLFAGTGALGIEALSRGAGRCTFVESDRGAVQIIEENVTACGLVDRATVRRDDAVTWCARAGRSDVVLIDPPYGFDRWAPLLADVRADLVVIESNRSVELGPRWQLVRERSYGTTVVTFATPTISSPDASPPSSADPSTSPEASPT